SRRPRPPARPGAPAAPPTRAPVRAARPARGSRRRRSPPRRRAAAGRSRCTGSDSCVPLWHTMSAIASPFVPAMAQVAQVPEMPREAGREDRRVSRRATAQPALVIGALGVVFGDLGTSPLYTIQTAFNPHDPHPVGVSHESIFGIVSLVFWAVTIIVT